VIAEFSLVAKLKQEAKAARDFDDFSIALEALDKAIKLLKTALENGLALPENQRPAPISDIKRELADCYGMKGGLYRRESTGHHGAQRDALLAKAEEMYESGAALEQNDSYNLTNTIVIPLLRNPDRLPELRPKAIAARDEVQRQVDGPRRSQWWAWADLGLLNLLAGESSRALQAYAQFGRVGAQVQDCQSTINVLHDLKNNWPSDEMRKRFDDAIAVVERQRISVS
jgi:tetratricopeptide (TPR) repeat protein